MIKGEKRTSSLGERSSVIRKNKFIQWQTKLTGQKRGILLGFLLGLTQWLDNTFASELLGGSGVLCRPLTATDLLPLSSSPHAAHRFDLAPRRVGHRRAGVSSAAATRGRPRHGTLRRALVSGSESVS